MELTEEQIARQDFVDSTILSLVGYLVGFETTDIKHDIEWVAEIRDTLEQVICRRLGLMTEQEFYPRLPFPFSELADVSRALGEQCEDMPCQDHCLAGRLPKSVLAAITAAQVQLERMETDGRN